MKFARPEGEPRRSHFRFPAAQAAYAAGWMTLATLLQILRQLGAPALDTIWAEDGKIFLNDAFNGTFFGVLVKPYNGYIHVIPRLVAELASAMPLRWSSAILSGGAAVIVSALSLYVYTAAREGLPRRLYRGSVAAAMVVLPAAYYEALNNVANVQWYCLFATFWALLDRRDQRVWVAIRIGLVFLTAATTPLAALFLPMALFQLWRCPRWKAAAIVTVFLFALVGQFVVALSVGKLARFAPTFPLDIPVLFAIRVVGGLLIGDLLVRFVWSSMGGWFSVIALTALLALMIEGIRVLDAWARNFFLVILFHSVLLFAVPVLLRGTEHLAPDGAEFDYSGSRYVIAPMLLLISAAVLVLEYSRAISRNVKIGVAVWSVVVAITGFPAWNGRANGPRWSAGVREAERECAGPDLPDATRISISPPDPTFWYVVVPCSRVLGSFGVR